MAKYIEYRLDVLVYKDGDVVIVSGLEKDIVTQGKCKYEAFVRFYETLKTEYDEGVYKNLIEGTEEPWRNNPSKYTGFAKVMVSDHEMVKLYIFEAQDV